MGINDLEVCPNTFVYTVLTIYAKVHTHNVGTLNCALQCIAKKKKTNKYQKSHWNYNETGMLDPKKKTIITSSLHS